MKQRVISFCAEYGIYIGACGTLFFIIRQSSLHEQLFQFFTITSLICIVWVLGALLKYSIRKERPHVEKRLSILRDKYSFPSMHALTLSTVATYISVHSLYLGLFIFLIAFIVMYARIRTHMHFAVDMAAGFFFGVVLTFIIAPYTEKYMAFFLTTYGI